MRTLVFGGTGMVGRAVAAEASQRGWPALALGHAQADITDRGAVLAAAAEFRPQLVVNCAAFTRVDDCESAAERAFAVNADAVAHLAEAADNAGARLLHLSSDYVFDGAARAPYREDAATAPLSVYGASKLAGEQAALGAAQATVVRTSWVFGPGGANFVDTIVRLWTSGAPLRVVDDQVGCPTYTPFLARALCDLAERGRSGVVHYRNREPVSWHGFATAIAAALAGAPNGDSRPPGATTVIEAISTEQFPRPAARPAYSVLDVGRFEAEVGRRVEPWDAGLAEYLDFVRNRRH